MSLSVDQLQNPPTRAECTDFLIKLLQRLGFQTTGWQEGRLAHTILNTAASGLSAFAQLSATMINNTNNETAAGTALTYYSDSRFSNTRIAAVATVGPFTLTNSGTASYEISAGQLIFTSNGITFTNTGSGTSVPGEPIDIDVVCSTLGDVGNIANNSTITLQTPLAGVTVTNPSPGQDSEGNDLPWYTTTGSDQETDSELRLRNSTKWGLLAVEKTETAVVNLALKQDGVEKAIAVTDNPRGDYTVDVYVSGSTSLISTAQITAAQENFAKYTFGTESVWPPTDLPKPSAYYLKNPTLRELILKGNIYYNPVFSESDMQDRVETALNDFVKLIPIGGRNYTNGATNLVTVGDIYETIETVQGVESVTLSEVGPNPVTSPVGDIKLAETDLLTGPDDWFGATKLVLAPVNT